ncbi:Mlp family lipoprotein [Borrelia coriaceae]|nr:Mlp family lipoprotein [Borrelia coriaceae]
MQIFIKLLVLCSTLFLYCCNSDKINGTSDKTIPKPHKLPNKGPNNLQTKTRKPAETRTDTLTAENTITNKPPETRTDTLTAENTITNKPPETRVATLIDDEKQKFDVLINAFNKVIELKLLPDDELQKSQNFLNWIRSKDVQEQKELANAFTLVYDFLKDTKPSQLNNLTLTQLISNTLTCGATNQCNDTYTNIQDIQMFFTNVLKQASFQKDTNAMIFQALKIELLNPHHHGASSLGKKLYERRIRMQLKNDNNRTQAFNFLINAFPQDMYNTIYEILKIAVQHWAYTIMLDSILDHIHTELNKCNGNEAGKNNLAIRIKDYFVKAEQDNTSYTDHNIFNKFKTEVLSDCQK